MVYDFWPGILLLLIHATLISGYHSMFMFYKCYLLSCVVEHKIAAGQLQILQIVKSFCPLYFDCNRRPWWTEETIKSKGGT